MINTSLIFLILRIAVALVLLQTLLFKFAGAGESVEFFKQLSNFLTGEESMQATLRIGSGLLELLAVVLILMKKPAAIASGACLAVVMIAGAVFTHLKVTGIGHGSDVTLFVVMVIALMLSLAVLFRYRGSLPVLGRFT